MGNRFGFSGPFIVTTSANASPGTVGNTTMRVLSDGRRGRSDRVTVRLEPGEEIVRVEPVLSRFWLSYVSDGHDVMQLLAAGLFANFHAAAIFPDGSSHQDFTVSARLGIRDNADMFDDAHHGFVGGFVIAEIQRT